MLSHGLPRTCVDVSCDRRHYGSVEAVQGAGRTTPLLLNAQVFDVVM